MLQYSKIKTTRLYPSLPKISIGLGQFQEEDIIVLPPRSELNISDYM